MSQKKTSKIIFL